MNALTVRGISKRFGQGCDACFTEQPLGNSNRCQQCGCIVALKNVSFDLPCGELLGIMGESGSGKSTLLRCLFFDEVPDAGSAMFRDQDCTYDLFALNRAEMRRLKNRAFSIVHQNPRLGLNFKTSAGGNVAERVLTAGHRHYGDIRHTATTLLSRTRVPTDRLDELPGNFSGGMQQRVQIAKALSIEPVILFLDEVTSGLDLSVQAQILDLIQELHQQLRISILLVTHDIGVVKLLASQTLIMKHGEVVEAGLTDQILEDPQHPYTQELVGAAL